LSPLRQATTTVSPTNGLIAERPLGYENRHLRCQRTPIDQLKAISSWVSSVQDLDKLLQLIIESATGVVRAEAASLLLLDPKTNTLYFKVATGAKGEAVKEFRVKIGQGIAGHVAQTGQPLLIADAQQDDRWMREISDSIDYETRSMACVPLKINGSTIGVVQVINKKDNTQFTQRTWPYSKSFPASPLWPSAVPKTLNRFAGKILT
jgi:transcriptional regulator with GAF, ATPase, and Fis domain